MATVLITGASAGIGEALVRLSAAKGHQVIVTARRKDRLEKLAAEIGGGAVVIEGDLADRAAPERLVQELNARGLDVDILVNNAGFGAFGKFVELPAQRQMEMLQVNVVALTHLTRLLLPAMVARGRGRIMNVASTAAFQPGPLMAVYYASKAYVLSFSEALSHEVRGTGVTITTLCPGPTESEFQKAANMTKSKVMQGVIMTSEEVAEVGYHGMMRGKRVIIPGFKNRILAGVSKVSPHSVTLPVVEYMQSERH